MPVTMRMEVEGVGKLARDFDQAERQVQNRINRTMRELEKVSTRAIAAAAPRESGALARSVQGTIYFRGHLVRITFTADAQREGFSYLNVTRFGHRLPRIFPKRAKALTVPGRGRGGRTVLKTSVAGYRPSHDWVDVAAQDVEGVVDVAARELSRDIATVVAR